MSQPGRRGGRKLVPSTTMFVHRSPLRKKVARAASVCAAVLLAFVVVVDVTQAARTYVYCTAMQEVMSHGCCQRHQAATSVPTLTARGPDCCQDRVVPSLGAWTSSDRSFVPAAPLLAAVSRTLFEALPILAPPVELLKPSLRAGPPLSRVLAQIMVLRL